MTVQEIRKKLRKLTNEEKSKILQEFFKTGPGEYGEGDVFLGITVPVLRKMSGEYDGVPIKDALQLLQSSIHEERLLAIFLLIRAYSNGDEVVKKNIYCLYLKNTRYINNWDLVDLSAPNIVGVHLLDRSRKPLYTLAKSRDLWKRRISIMSTFSFIKRNDFFDTLRISRMLIADDHDLIHKAVGGCCARWESAILPLKKNFSKDIISPCHAPC